MAYKLRILEIPLQKEYETTSVPFFYTEKQASFQYQLQYYQIQEYHVRDSITSQLLLGKKDLKGKPVLPGGLNNHLCTWRTTLESQKGLNVLKNEQHLLDQKNASATSWNLAESWIKSIEKLGDNFTEIDGVQLVTDFLLYFRKYGLFDCRSASFTTSRTLQYFYVLLDLVPQAADHCISLITKHMDMLPGFGFLKPGEVDLTLEELWKPALLSVLLEPDQSSTIFTGGLAYLENRAIHAAFPDICLLVGDIHDPELFGFNHSEYVEKRLELYRKASKSPECQDVATFRSLSIITLLPEEFMTKIAHDMTNKGVFDPSILASLPTEFPSMVAYTDFLIMKPLEELSSVKHRLLSEIQTQEKGETIAGLEKLADTVSRHLQPGICRLFVKDSLSPVKVSLELKEYTKVITQMIDLLKTKMPLDQMSELLQMVIDLLNGLKDSSPMCASEIEARKSIECFEIIKHRFLDYAIEKGHLQSSLYFLGKLYMEAIDLKTGLNILMSGFLLVPASVSDLSFRRRTFKYLLFRSERVNERETARQITSYIEEQVSEEATADELREKVSKMVIDWIEDRIMKQKYAGSNKEAFAESIKGETIRPSISYALSTIQKVLSGQQPPIKDHFTDLEVALQDIFKPKSFFSKLSPLGLSGLTKSEDSAPVAHEPKETVLTVNDVRREICADPKLRLFAKECFEITGSVGGLETFEYNGCNIYKGYFHNNQQKVTIFEVDYGDLFSPSIFKSVLTYLKIFHQHTLCFYGVIVEKGEAPGSIKIYYVGEHVDWFLSRASATHIEGLSDNYRAGVCTDILSCLASFHTAGIPLCQLNPDLVAFSSGKAKVIFPFFLNSRLFFTNHYLGTRVTDDVMYPSLLFIKPEILRKPDLLSGGGVSPFRKDFNQKFGPNMNGDLYSFTLIVAYLHLPRFFSRAEFTPSSSIQNYFTRTFTNSMRGAWAEELFASANLAKLRSILTTLYKETTLPVNTFKLLAMFKTAWAESVADVTPMSTRRSFVESLAFNTPQPLTSYAYFPCGIIADWPEEDPAMSRVYLQSNLLMLGPYWSAQETDSYQLELYSDDFESIKFEIIKGSISKAKLILKERRGEEVAQRAKLQIDSFCTNTFLPKRSVLEALMLPFKNLETPRNKDPLHAGLTSLRSFLAAADKLCTETESSQTCLLDPFGNQVWATISDAGFPELSGPVFIESFAAHNMGKSMVLIQDKHPGRWMSSRIGTFGLGETSEPWNKYVDLIRDFDCINWSASMVLSPLGFVFNGSLKKGFLQRGVVIDPTKSATTEVDSGDYAEQEVQLSGNLVYRGEICNHTLNGQGVLLRNNKQVYQGCFKDGLPHGKGKVSSNFDEQTAFTGYFRHGKPVYGTIIGKKKSCYGWIVSPPDGMEGGLVFSNHNTGLNSWLLGFSVDSISPVLFALQTPEFTFEEMILGDKLAIAQNAQYEGALEDKVPHGRGVLEIRGLGSLHGIFKAKTSKSDKQLALQVTGNFIPEDKRVSAAPLLGEFDLQPFQMTGSLGVQGYCSSRDGQFSGLLKTYLTHSGALAVCWEQVSHQYGHGSRDLDNSKWVDLVKIEATNTTDNPVWEDWSQPPSEELRIFSSQADIQIKQLPMCKIKEFTILGRVKKLGNRSYEASGPMELARAEFKFELVFKDQQICGTMKSQDNKVLFSGFFDEHLQPKLGRLETFSPHRVASGHFSRLQLEGEGILEHPSEIVVVEGRFASGKKEGLAIAYVNKEKTLICSYQEDVRHGHALRLWPHGRQLMEFNYGDLSVVFEVEEFK